MITIHQPRPEGSGEKLSGQGFPLFHIFTIKGLKSASPAFIMALILTLAPVFTSTHCQADTIYTVIVKKQEEKEKVRWSLSDWLDTRDKMRLQDLWLALHSPSPYEFFISANYQFNQASSGVRFNGSELAMAAFVSIFGLEVNYESGIVQHWSGIFDFRVFGFHDQSTNITLQLGVRNTSNENITFRNALAGLRLSIYLARPFGIEALYRHYYSSTPNASDITSSGNRHQIGAFLEFRFLRFYGDYFNEAESLFSSNGVQLGSKIYF